MDFKQEDMNLALEEMMLEAKQDIEDAEKKDEEEEKEDEVDEKEAEESLACAALLDLASPDEIAEAAESAEDIRNLSATFGVAMERTIIRMDRKGRFSHLSKQAELNLARKNGDPTFKKLMKIWKIERALEAKIHQRWGSKAQKVAKIKIRDYAANGRRIAKPNPSTVAFKGKVSGQVAQRAVNNAKKMFSPAQAKK